jgi:hypothetical protein
LAPSRESLHYDERTIKKIESLIDAAMHQMQIVSGSILAKLGTPGNMVVAAEMQSYSGFLSIESILKEFKMPPINIKLDEFIEMQALLQLQRGFFGRFSYLDQPYADLMATMVGHRSNLLVSDENTIKLEKQTLDTFAGLYLYPVYIQDSPRTEKSRNVSLFNEDVRTINLMLIPKPNQSMKIADCTNTQSIFDLFQYLQIPTLMYTSAKKSTAAAPIRLAKHGCIALYASGCFEKAIIQASSDSTITLSYRNGNTRVFSSSDTHLIFAESIQYTADTIRRRLERNESIAQVRGLKYPKKNVILVSDSKRNEFAGNVRDFTEPEVLTLTRVETEMLSMTRASRDMVRSEIIQAIRGSSAKSKWIIQFKKLIAPYLNIYKAEYCEFASLFSIGRDRIKLVQRMLAIAHNRYPLMPTYSANHSKRVMSDYVNMVEHYRETHPEGKTKNG